MSNRLFRFSLATACFQLLACTVLSVGVHAAEISKELLVGTWTLTEFAPNGAKVETIATISPDGTFTTVGTANAKPFMHYSGKWSLKDDKLTSTILKSDLAVTEAQKNQVDSVLILNDRELVLKSQSNGKRETYLRKK